MIGDPPFEGTVHVRTARSLPGLPDSVGCPGTVVLTSGTVELICKILVSSAGVNCRGPPTRDAKTDPSTFEGEGK